MKRSRGRKAAIDMDALLYTSAGALVSLGLNAGIKAVTKTMLQEAQKETLAKVLPFIKGAGGYALASMTKDSRLQQMGVGMMAESAVEVALVNGGKVFQIGISGINGFGDVFTAIGSPYKYDSLPGGVSGYMYKDDDFTEGDELIAGPRNADELIV